MNNRITTKNHAAFPGIEFLTKSISKSYDRDTAMPPAWWLKNVLRKANFFHVWDA